MASSTRSCARATRPTAISLHLPASPPFSHLLTPSRTFSQVRARHPPDAEFDLDHVYGYNGVSVYTIVASKNGNTRTASSRLLPPPPASSRLLPPPPASFSA